MEIKYLKTLVASQRFLFFAKNMGKNVSNKYGQKLLDSAKKSTIDAIKTASKRAIQKTAEATGDLIGNKSVSTKKSTKELQDKKTEVDTSKKRYISPEEKKIIDELRLLPKDKKDTSLQKEDNKLLMN